MYSSGHAVTRDGPYLLIAEMALVASKFKEPFIYHIRTIGDNIQHKNPASFLNAMLLLGA